LAISRCPWAVLETLLWTFRRMAPPLSDIFLCSGLRTHDSSESPKFRISANLCKFVQGTIPAAQRVNEVLVLAVFLVSAYGTSLYIPGYAESPEGRQYGWKIRRACYAVLVLWSVGSVVFTVIERYNLLCVSCWLCAANTFVQHNVLPRMGLGGSGRAGGMDGFGGSFAR